MAVKIRPSASTHIPAQSRTRSMAVFDVYFLPNIQPARLLRVAINPSTGHDSTMASLDRSIRSCTYQVIPTCFAVTAIAFVTVILVFAFQGNPLHRNVAIGFTASLGALIGLFLLGKVYIFYRGPPEPIPDEERPSSTDSDLHPTMAPMQSRQEPQEPRHPMGPRQMEEAPAPDRSSPDFREIIPRPLNVPSRPQQAFNTLPRAHDNGNRYPRSVPSGPRDCPPSLTPGPSRYQQPRVSTEPEEARRQTMDANGSPINGLLSMRGQPFIGSGYGDLPRSAPGIHTNHVHVNLVTVPSCPDFQLFCKKNNLLQSSPRSPKFRPSSPKFRKLTPQSAKLWARRGGVKKHRIKISSPTTLIAPAMQIIIDDNIGSVHSESSGGIESPTSSGPPSSADTLISMEISKA
ncbi:hypothetical protein F5X68DRAFT_240543 [Plectosphaerella plurivora]|uniref:Uncharacterized protein n=1 Tax=Plectosphaerella plurivora TaxID=936078 RepID=A0A9P8VAH4_9PEZI|nr:hypothetical protein F5X68DRAFT_240543 [Plectosphaerella plurivora]